MFFDRRTMRRQSSNHEKTDNAQQCWPHTSFDFACSCSQCNCSSKYFHSVFAPSTFVTFSSFHFSRLSFWIHIVSPTTGTSFESTQRSSSSFLSWGDRARARRKTFPITSCYTVFAISLQKSTIFICQYTVFHWVSFSFASPFAHGGEQNRSESH
jgi:hypothetical protein